MAKKQVTRPEPADEGTPTPETPPESIQETPPDSPPSEKAEANPDAIQKVAKKPAAKKGIKAAKKEVAPKPKPAVASRRSQGVWGIDVGQCALKAVRLEEIDGVVTVTAFDYIEHAKILSQPDADRDALIREALEKLLANNNHLKGDIVAISVPGQSALARFVKLPPVQQDKIHDIVKFEAKQQIPFNLEEVIWDYQKVGEGEVLEGFAMDTEIGLFAMKRDAINANLQHFKDVGVEVDCVQIAPLALCNFATYDSLKQTPGEPATSSDCVVVLDMGADSTNLVVTDGARIIWQKVISTGGNHFTRALTKDLKLTFAKAEHTKRNAAKSPDLKKILASLKPVLSEFEAELRRSLNFFQNSHKQAELKYILGMGNAFRLPGLQKFLEEKLGMPVKRLQKFERLTGDAVLNAPVFQENIGTFATAYGLALQGLKKTRLVTNLLPPELRTERMIRAKKPWAVAASALLMVGLAACMMRYTLDARTYGDPGIETAVKSARETTKRAGEATAAFNKEKGDAIAEEEGVKSVVAGQKELTNWLELTSFVSSVIPRPDASNLMNPAARDRYFTKIGPERTISGQGAYKEWLGRRGSLRMAEVPVEEPGITPMPMTMPPGMGVTPVVEEDLGKGVEDLIQFNIEGVDCRYSANLEGVWKAIKEKVRTPGDYLPTTAHGTPPTFNKGWVVEIRGFTFHTDKRNFILQTLCENIARKGRPDVVDKPATPPMPGMPETPEAPKLPDKGPVLNRISHIVLFHYDPQLTSETTNFKVIGQTVLDQVVTEAIAAGPGTGPMPGAGPAPMQPGGEGQTPGATPAGISRDTWTPLGGTPTGGTGPGGPGTGGGRPNPNPNPNPNPMQPTGQPSKYTRTEFVVLFFWNELTPSDALRGQTEEGAPGTPMSGQFPGQFPGRP